MQYLLGAKVLVLSFDDLVPSHQCHSLFHS